MEGAIFLAILIPIAIIVLMIVLLVRMGALSRELEAMRRQMAEWMSAQPARATAPEAPPIIRPAAAPPPAEPIAPRPSSLRRPLHHLRPPNRGRQPRTMHCAVCARPSISRSKSQLLLLIRRIRQW
jgi:hypothetical protein